jgi:hypothetical protein
MNSEQALGEIIIILSPYLAKTLTVMDNPIPRIKEVLEKLEPIHPDLDD